MAVIGKIDCKSCGETKSELIHIGHFFTHKDTGEKWQYCYDCLFVPKEIENDTTGSTESRE